MTLCVKIMSSWKISHNFSECPLMSDDSFLLGVDPVNPPHLWAPLAMIVVAVGIRTRWIGSRTIVGLDDNEKKKDGEKTKQGRGGAN